VRRAALAAVAAAFLGVTAQAFAGVPAQPLGHEGRWITDDHGRVVLIHAVNMVYKRPPYYPKAIGFGKDDAQFLHRHGFNGVRLGVIYAGVEPTPGKYDNAYIDTSRPPSTPSTRTASSRCSTSTRTSTTRSSRARAGPTGRSRTTASPTLATAFPPTT